MHKILALALSFIICRVFGITDIWLLFVPVYFIFMFPDISGLSWESLLCALTAETILAFSGEYALLICRILMVCSAVFFAFRTPRKLLLFFPLAVLSLFFLPEKQSFILILSALCCSIHLNFTTIPHNLQAN